jgi:hypothetical protein
MDDWYLQDAEGRVVGPVGGAVAADLLRERPGLFTHVSSDAVNWVALRASTVTRLAPAEPPQARRQREEQRAQHALLELDRFQELRPNELFGVPWNASLADHQRGYQALASRFDPASLPADTAPALRDAYLTVYRHLAGVMNKVESRLGAPRQQPRPAQPTAPAGPPVWSLDALALKRLPHVYEGAVEVTEANCLIFSIHRMMNMKNQSAFFPCVPPLSLGSRMDITFTFPQARRQVRARGAVVLEARLADPQQHLRGFGVQFDLSKEDKGFILQETRRLAPQAWLL